MHTCRKIHSAQDPSHTHTRISIFTSAARCVSVARAERERHPCHERLSRVLRVRGGVGGQRCVRGVCRVCGVRREGGVGCVGAEGQWSRVDVVVVHDGTRQDQLQQAGDTIETQHIYQGWGTFTVQSLRF